MNKRWVIDASDEEAINHLQSELKVSRILCDLLVKRGIRTFDQAKKFFRPNLEDLHDPFLMQDMDLAIERIGLAMRENEKILIYGDYDVDGTTAVALVYGFFRQFYYNLAYYIPDRYIEGYGVSDKSIDYAHKEGFSLIIALDCGIKANDKIARAKDLGIDYIICDHHRPGEELPPAYAVLDPKREDCTYPYTELSGCGVGFKMVQAFAQHNDMPFKEVTDLLDLVAVSIAADIVPVTGENRILAHYGLRKLNHSPCPGLLSLVTLSGMNNKKINISDIVFYVAPRINAAGRMDSGNTAVKVLCAEENASAFINADMLDSHNTDRREIDKSITEEALKLVRKDEVLLNKKSIALYNPSWHKGVIGIVASRMVENFYRPSIILTDSDDVYAAGSARSVKHFDIYNAIRECEVLLEQFGGHKYAAGLTIRKENIPAFIEKFEKIVAQTIDDESLTPEVKVDAELELSYFNMNFYKIIEQFAPFGPANMKPIFVTKGLTDRGNSMLVGHTKKHLKVHATSSGYNINGIAFNQAPFYQTVKEEEFDVCYSLDLNEWNGNKSLQMTIKDIKVKEDLISNPV